jgi:hypothetical protein
MSDVASDRTAAVSTHAPTVIYAMLYGLSLACGVLVGFALGPAKDREWTHWICFAATTALTLYIILDLEYPRFGLIRVDWADRFLVELRESMK